MVGERRLPAEMPVGEAAVRLLGGLGVRKRVTGEQDDDAFAQLVRAWDRYLDVALPMTAPVLEVYDTKTHRREPYVRVMENGEPTSVLPPERYVVAQTIVDARNQELEVDVREETDVEGRRLFRITQLDAINLAPEVDKAILAATPPQDETA